MVKEVVQAAEWLTSVIKDKDTILNGDSVLKLSNIDTSNEAGRRLYWLREGSFVESRH